MRKFLVVDDEALNCRLLREILEQTACCDCVYNGPEAIALFKTAHTTNVPYDLILLDISMPEMDGLEVVEIIRNYEQSEGILLGDGVPIIMVTAIKEAFMKAFKRGADDYVLKPVEQDELMKKINKQLEKSRQ